MLVAGAITLIIALAAAGLGLEILFERHVERHSIAMLKTDIRQLLAGLQIGDSGTITLSRSPSDQRYHQPFSGLYWQMRSATGTLKRSRSLWDEVLKLPVDDAPEHGYHVHQIPGLKKNTTLLAIERKLSVRLKAKTYVFRVAAAMDRSEIASAVKNFRLDLSIALSLLGICLMIAFWAAINVGLSPLVKLRKSLGLLRDGRARRLTGKFPMEVAPLATDLNDLLDRQDVSIEYARARAADLAHGLKTPLTAISMLAEEMRDRGDLENAAELADTAASMRRHIERELVLARATSFTLRKVEVSKLNDVIGQMIRIMRRLPGGAELQWDVEMAQNISLRLDEVVLREVLGNLLDNARKWARSRVLVKIEDVDGFQIIKIIDDGPGVPPEKLDEIQRRGGRLDRNRDGSGLGLSIVRDTMVQLRGKFSVYSPPRGQHRGLEVVVEFNRRANVPGS